MFAIAAILLMSLPLAAGAQMANGITTPKDGATVKGTVDVTGYASDPNFKQVAVGPAARRQLRMRRSSWPWARSPASSPTR